MPERPDPGAKPDPNAKPDANAASAWIDATLEALPADQRAALQALRQTIAAAAPEAVETISYGMPAFGITAVRWSPTRPSRSTARCSR